ncbi:hypothetical protein BFP70_12165 [Thioclava sp. SK-1]|uniref:flagellar hook-length control protein FliK n=1 Tax=Thioclava sp. SK-1 TaxID=1889770 RepID=UPI00085585C6|nr:flagellar hook-length control protein FliK [Thioclava sp. SK-1]OCX63401.1 hypothetical protein BFP70_12165 [Thioclava sp. SK-1]
MDLFNLQTAQSFLNTQGKPADATAKTPTAPLSETATNAEDAFFVSVSGTSTPRVDARFKVSDLPSASSTPRFSGTDFLAWSHEASTDDAMVEYEQTGEDMPLAEGAVAVQMSVIRVPDAPPEVEVNQQLNVGAPRKESSKDEPSKGREADVVGDSGTTNKPGISAQVGIYDTRMAEVAVVARDVPGAVNSSVAEPLSVSTSPRDGQKPTITDPALPTQVTFKTDSTAATVDETSPSVTSAPISKEAMPAKMPSMSDREFAAQEPAAKAQALMTGSTVPAAPTAAPVLDVFRSDNSVLAGLAPKADAAATQRFVSAVKAESAQPIMGKAAQDDGVEPRANRQQSLEATLKSVSQVSIGQQPNQSDRPATPPVTSASAMTPSTSDSTAAVKPTSLERNTTAPAQPTSPTPDAPKATLQDDAMQTPPQVSPRVSAGSITDGSPRVDMQAAPSSKAVPDSQAGQRPREQVPEQIVAPQTQAQNPSNAVTATVATSQSALITKLAAPLNAATELQTTTAMIDESPSVGFALTSPAAPVTHDGATHTATTTLAQSVSQQVTAAVKTLPDGPVEISLSPEELGKVRLVLQSSDSSMTVLVQAERPETLDLMRRNIDQLSKDMRALGYSDVSFSFSDSNQNRQRSAEGWSRLQDVVSAGAGDLDPRRASTADLPTQSPTRATGLSGLDLRM